MICYVRFVFGKNQFNLQKYEKNSKYGYNILKI